MRIYHGERELMGHEKTQRAGREITEKDRAVHLRRFSDDLPSDDFRVFALHFPAGYHTRWHVHTGRQVMYAIFGRGIVCEEGRDPVQLVPGDVVYLEPGVRHWHGAVADDDFVHTVIAFDQKTHWTFRTSDDGEMRPHDVSETEYRAAVGS